MDTRRVKRNRLQKENDVGLSGGWVLSFKVLFSFVKCRICEV